MKTKELLTDRPNSNKIEGFKKEIDALVQSIGGRVTFTHDSSGIIVILSGDMSTTQVWQVVRWIRDFPVEGVRVELTQCMGVWEVPEC